MKSFRMFLPLNFVVAALLIVSCGVISPSTSTDKTAGDAAASSNIEYECQFTQSNFASGTSGTLDGEFVAQESMTISGINKSVSKEINGHIATISTGGGLGLSISQLNGPSSGLSSIAGVTSYPQELWTVLATKAVAYSLSCKKI